MNIKDVENVKTQGEAREFAIQWQQWFSEQNMSWSELSEWEIVFENLAKRFDLVEEFIENGILGDDIPLTDLQIERQDFVDGRIYEMLKDVLGKEIDWDISVIGAIRDVIVGAYVYNDEEEMDFYPYIAME